MVRRYDEPVDVQARPGAPDEPDEPTAFVWRGRLYVVRGVLAHWYERRAWWRDTASLTLLGLRADGGPQGAEAATVQGTVAASAATSVLAGAGEREVWRVEAAAGRSSPVGVYELVRDPLPGPRSGTRSSTRSGTPSNRLPSQPSSGGSVEPSGRSAEGSGPPGSWRLTRVDD
jgi:hypothetical protein